METHEQELLTRMNQTPLNVKETFFMDCLRRIGRSQGHVIFSFDEGGHCTASIWTGTPDKQLGDGFVQGQKVLHIDDAFFSAQDELFHARREARKEERRTIRIETMGREPIDLEVAA